MDTPTALEHVSKDVTKATKIPENEKASLSQMPTNIKELISQENGDKDVEDKIRLEIDDDKNTDVIDEIRLALDFDKDTEETNDEVRLQRDSNKGTKETKGEVRLQMSEDKTLDENIEEDEKKDAEKTLLEDESVKIEIKNEGDDTPTLQLPQKKKKKSLIGMESLSKGLQLTRSLSLTEPAGKTKGGTQEIPILRNFRFAWNKSSNIFEFIIRATCILFVSLGWLFCVGGVPFISLVMLIMGAVYLNDCPAQPKIPIYLIVTGLFGTIQHFIAAWTKYFRKNPKESLEGLKNKCIWVDAVLEIFLVIWFICGCTWVYSIYEPEYDMEERTDVYCNKIVYLFSFWILNLSFILLAFLICFCFCGIIAVASSSKAHNKPEE